LDSATKTSDEVQRLTRISQEIGGPTFAAELAAVVPQIVTQIGFGGAVGFGGSKIGLKPKTVSNIGFGSSVGVAFAQSYGGVLSSAFQQLEKEKIDVWKSKVEVSKDMQENKFFSKKWIYENVFGLSDQDMIDLQKQLVDDAKGTYRFKQIEEEGNDPAIKFLQSKDEGDGDAGAGPADGSADTEAADTTPPTEKPPGESKPSDKQSKPSEPPAKLAERDQTGRKDASKYPFGEDSLGGLENNRKSDLSVTHKYKNKSPLSLESLKGLSDLLNTVEDEKKILREGEEKSYMDEINIKE
jgi:hypothetical protein